MTVSPGDLDSLLDTSYSAADFAGVDIQSETGASGTSGTYSTVTLNTISLLALPVGSGDLLQVIAVDDANNSITLSGTIDGTVYQSTQYVVGYSSDGLLLSTGSASAFSDQLAANATSGSFSSSDGQTTVLSSSPIPVGTGLTFSETGSASLGQSTTQSLTVLDTTTNLPITAATQAYSGPVAGLTSEFVTSTPDSLDVSVSTPGWFIHTGGGNDAISVSSGTNVLDGSTGSNFMTGGSGDDTFFVDDRNPTSNIWSTVNNFHSGDAATIWGVTPSDFTLTWLDGQGAVGYTGLTLGATSAGKPTTNLTLVGFTSADLTNGKLTVTFGTTPTTDGVAGSSYMLIQAT